MDADKREEVKDIFRKYDKNGDGGISIEELVEVMKALGRFTAPEVKKIFAHMDTNRDGSIQYEEFVNWVFGAGAKANLKARETILHSNDPFQICFYNFSGKGSDMDGKSFTKLCKDTGLINKAFTTTDTDIIFVKSIPKGARRMTLPQFEKACGLIAAKKGVDEQEIREAVMKCAGPVLAGTAADNVRFHDDKSTYTGAHKEAGSPSSRARTPAAEVEAYPFGPDAERLFRDFCGNRDDLDGKGWAKLCKDARLIGGGLSAPDADVIFTTVVAKVAGRGAGRMTWPMFQEAMTRLALKKQISPSEVEEMLENCDGPQLNATKSDSVRFHDDKSTYTGAHRDSSSPGSRPRTAPQEVEAHSFGGEAKDLFMSFSGNGQDLDGKGWAKFCKDAGLMNSKFTGPDADVVFTTVVAKTSGRGAGRMTYPMFEEALTRVALKKGVDVEVVEEAIANCRGPTRNATQADNVRFHDDKSSYTGMHAADSPTRSLKGSSSAPSFSGSPGSSPSRRRGSGAPEALPSYTFNDSVDRVFDDFCNGGRTLDGKSFAKLCKDAGLVNRSFSVTDADLLFTKVMKGKGRQMAIDSFYEALLGIAAKTGAEPQDVELRVINCSGPVRNATQADAVRFHDDKSTYTGMHNA